jgi:putative transcriptional regulator
MAQLFRSKKSASIFQILVEIAASQPNIQQKDIAEKIDITPQAVSEYIRELIDRKLIVSDRRSRYRVTQEGVNWILESSRELQTYANFVNQVVTNISVSPAIADTDLNKGQAAGLFMKEGLLHASHSVNTTARGTVASDAKKGEEVAISNIEGIIELKPGSVTICKIPGIQHGGSKNIDLNKLAIALTGKTIIGVIGIESLMALKRLRVPPTLTYGVTEAALQAAQSGLSPVIVCTEENTSSLINGLEKENIHYELLDLRTSPQK